MTKTQTAKLSALRSEADLHGDTATVTLVDAALAGDVEAAAKLRVAAKAVRAISTGVASRAPRRERNAWGSGPATPSHPWAHDEE